MTRIQSIKTIERELKRLNERIDLKIIQGQNYVSESKMHRMLLDKIRKMRKRSFFNKLSMALTIF